MKSVGKASALRQGLVHQALIYHSDQGFLDVALPFVEEGICLEEPTLVAVQGRNVDNLREALGGEPAGVRLLSVEQWYETSARTRDKFAAWAGERVHGDGGTGRVRLIGEPPWALGHEAQIRDWARNESVVNVAFEGMPVTFICPYDARALPEDVLDHALSTHPEIVEASGWSSSGEYEDPAEFCRRLSSSMQIPAGTPVGEVEFTIDDLPLLRRLVVAAATEAGLPPARTEELTLAVNEIATNAVLHGRPPATLRIWSAEDELLCEVSDAGVGIEDELAGQLRPAPRGRGGRGLWLARLLCDAVEIHNDPGCVVALRARV